VIALDERSKQKVFNQVNDAIQNAVPGRNVFFVDINTELVCVYIYNRNIHPDHNGSIVVLEPLKIAKLLWIISIQEKVYS
jgi:hypothetical protein